MKKRKGIAVTGCGMARNHLESLRRIGDFTVVATVDVVEEKAIDRSALETSAISSNSFWLSIDRFCSLDVSP